MIKQKYQAILFTLLLAFPYTIVMGDDDSCELKKDDAIIKSDNSTNEFTKDKTWRFKIDKNLFEDSTKTKQTQDNNHTISKEKDIAEI